MLGKYIDLWMSLLCDCTSSLYVGEIVHWKLFMHSLNLNTRTQRMNMESHVSNIAAFSDKGEDNKIF